MRRGERTYSAQRTYLRAGPRPALHLCSLDVETTDALSCSPALLLWCTPVLLCLEERISQLLLSSRSYFFPTRLGHRGLHPDRDPCLRPTVRLRGERGRLAHDTGTGNVMRGVIGADGQDQGYLFSFGEDG